MTAATDGARRFVRRWPATTTWLAVVVALQIVTLAYDVLVHR